MSQPDGANVSAVYDRRLARAETSRQERLVPLGQAGVLTGRGQRVGCLRPSFGDGRDAPTREPRPFLTPTRERVLRGAPGSAFEPGSEFLSGRARMLQNSRSWFRERTRIGDSTESRIPKCARERTVRV